MGGCETYGGRNRGRESGGRVGNCWGGGVVKAIALGQDRTGSLFTGLFPEIPAALIRCITGYLLFDFSNF